MRLFAKTQRAMPAAVWASVALAAAVLTSSPARSIDERRLSFYHTHTQETLTVTYAQGDDYVDSALQEINEFLSDFRTGDRVEIDPQLLDVIYDVRAHLGSDGVYEVISAYRSPETNDMLRSRGNGVAKNSQHVLGKAIDVRLRGTGTADLRDAAIDLQLGGVGYYEKSDFVHMDTGRVRRW